MSKAPRLTLHTASTAFEVESCLMDGEDIEGIERNNTPLISSIKRGNYEVFDALLSFGASPVSPNSFSNYMPIRFAAEQGRADMVQRLAEKGVDINVNKGGTPLAVASQKGFVPIVELLLLLGADVEKHDASNHTPLTLASEKGRLPVVERLLAAGADARTTGANNESALSLAAAFGHLEIVDQLILHGADIHHQSTHNTTALIRASEGGHLLVVEKLLDLQCDVNAASTSGMTALMWACLNERIALVKILLLHNADTTIKRKDGKTAIDLARSSEIKNLIKGLSFFFSFFSQTKGRLTLFLVHNDQ